MIAERLIGIENGLVEYKEMAERYANLSSQPDVYLVIPPSFQLVVGLNNQIVEAELQTIIAEIGNQLDLPVINLYSVTKGHNEYYSDGLHLNPLGNQVIASEKFTVISSMK